MGTSMSKELRAWQASGRSLKYGDYNIFYKHQVNPKQRDGSVLVCLHTLSLSSRQWSKVWPQFLEKFCEVFAIDLLGHGFSDKPFPYAYEISDWADHVETMLVENKISDFHIVSHGIGGLVALELLARQSNFEMKDDLRISGVCLSSVDLFPEVTQNAPVTQLLKKPSCSPSCACCLCFNTFAGKFSQSFSASSPPTKKTTGDFWQIMKSRGGYKASTRMPDASSLSDDQRERYMDAVRQRKVPVCAMYSPTQADKGKEYIKSWYETFPDVELHNLKEKTGYFGPLEDADSFLDIYFMFLRRLN